MIVHSSFELGYLWLPLIGFTIGLFASMLGGSGGFIILPVLTLLFNIPAHSAVTTSLAATLPVCLMGSMGHYQKGHMDARIGLVFALAGILGALSGAALTSLITPKQLKVCFGIYSMVIALFMIYKDYHQKRAMNSSGTSASLPAKKRITLGSLFGFMAGTITGAFGTSGTAPVMAGMFYMNLPLKMVVGTSILVVLINTVSALGIHFLVGEVDLTLVYFLTSGSLIGAFIGPKLLAGINTDRSEGAIRLWYALGMIVLGIVMIVK